jgi:hypothetical protein
VEGDEIFDEMLIDDSLFFSAKVFS